LFEYKGWIWAAKNGFKDLRLYMEAGDDVSKDGECVSLTEEIDIVLSEEDGVKQLLNEGVPLNVVSRRVADAYQRFREDEGQSDVAHADADAGGLQN
jgi:hypothetical protein